MLKTLGRTTWEEIKINEVFAIFSCDKKIEIMAKYNPKDAMELSCTTYMFWGGHIWMGMNNTEKYYKLPKSVQRLFKEE